MMTMEMMITNTDAIMTKMTRMTRNKKKMKRKRKKRKEKKEKKQEKRGSEPVVAPTRPKPTRLKKLKNFMKTGFTFYAQMRNGRLRVPTRYLLFMIS